MGQETQGAIAPIMIIGGGLAGCEAAWTLVQRGIPVILHEMRPGAMSPAHHTGQLAELVCSNSFKSQDPSTAAGLLKHELRRLGSIVLHTAEHTAVPAGAALAVDRDLFSGAITAALASHPLVEIVREEVAIIPTDRAVIVAAGPLPSERLLEALVQLTGGDHLSFFDAAAPIVEAAALDRRHIFAASRWGKGEGSDYLNIPLTREQYEEFVARLVAAERVEMRDFEQRELFQACQPVEEIARRGVDALRYGALKPIGLTDPITGTRPWAVVQLRQENAAQSAYNLVGFQTNLTFAEQRRVFGSLPGLSEDAFVRFGVMHRNAFIDAPRMLTPTLALRDAPLVRIAGQLSGSEGYLEAAATGLIAALDVVAQLRGESLTPPPTTTALGSLLAYMTDPGTRPYQPMHVNFGIIPPLAERVRGKRERYAAYSQRAVEDLERFLTDSANAPYGGNRV